MSGLLRSDRRQFLKQAAAVAFAAPAFIRNLTAAPPSEVVRHASFGASGMAGADLGAITSHKKVKFVCVADVDLKRAEALKKNHPELRVYQDWRELLDKEHKNLDSVNVSTPDHMHAPIGMTAMQHGLHVYGQKPLTHDVFESRRLAQVATEKKLVTQMGIQIHSSSEYRTAVALIQSDAIGKVKEVHSWSSKKWGDSSGLPQHEDPIPDGFNWDEWLGICAKRPFIGNGYYHPGNWRKRLDFGTGTFGDMGCHIFDPVFKAMDLTAPLTALSTGPAPSATNWANDAVVHFTFPQTKYSVGPTFPITWYDGDQRPSKEVTGPVLGDKGLPDQGSLFIGEKGALLLPHVAQPILLPEKQYEGFERPKINGDNHWHQFVEAVMGNGTTLAPFSYAGPLTESVLLGGVATHFPNKLLEWDAANVKFTNEPEAARLIRRTYRKGWEVAGLSDA
ncbi:MAG: Gfo/Idh/MocA family oxidoreductase [Planctomycetes bacterium]|nr:Gfo/Idh/MocA family oxidoreductase [Planctomycetota bacterium]